MSKIKKEKYIKEKRESIVDVWLEEDNLLLLTSWMRDNYTLEDVANKIGITKVALWKWRKQYPQIDKALRQGKELTDYKVENALLRLALGGRTKETKVIFEYDRMKGKMIEMRKEVLDKEVLPNAPAALAWLCNRQPDKWKKNRDNNIQLNNEDTSIQISVTRKGINNNNGVEHEIEMQKTSSDKKNTNKVNSIKENTSDNTDNDDWDDEE